MERIEAVIEKSERENALLTFPEVAAPMQTPYVSDSLWTRLRRFNLDSRRGAFKRIVTVDRTNNAHFAFDTLRTKILKIMRQNDWTCVAITSPTVGCGKTTVGVNLAFSFSHLKDCRTVLVDLDLRQPQVGRILGLESTHSMEQFLKGESSIEDTFVRYGDNLAIGANKRPISHAAELLQSPATTSIFHDLKSRLKPDVVIVDLPPMLVNDDVSAFLPNVDCVILVVAAEATSIAEIDLCESTLGKESNVLGVVLNKCEFLPEKYGY
jgi:Mrp family chromosome partitioning ATPase